MPIYAYRCEACGHTQDILQKMADPVRTQCPSCLSETFKKQLTAAGFQLKGSGWYATDFKGSPAAATPAKETPTTNESATPPSAAPAAPATTPKTDASDRSAQ
jgi:putative FmdB family regulatory protein